MQPLPEPAEPTPISPIDAAILGALHGPAELLPISSSGNVTLIAWLSGMPYASASSERRKSVEIALHAGTALALALLPPREGRPAPRGIRGLALRAGMLLPTAAAGLAARRIVRERLGSPETIAGGLAAGSAVLGAAALAGGTRPATEAGIADGLAIGISQAAGLWPGFSRSGSAIAAARLRGFAPADAARLARAGLVSASLAASALEAAEAAKGGIADHDLPAVAAGAAASFASAVAARPLATRLERTGSTAPWIGWRLLLAGAALLRIRSLREDGSR